MTRRSLERNENKESCRRGGQVCQRCLRRRVYQRSDWQGWRGIRRGRHRSKRCLRRLARTAQQKQITEGDSGGSSGCHGTQGTPYGSNYGRYPKRSGDTRHAKKLKQTRLILMALYFAFFGLGAVVFWQIDMMTKLLAEVVDSERRITHLEEQVSKQHNTKNGITSRTHDRLTLPRPLEGPLR
jgi:hypothetical protein